ncbi:hypothetical protein TUBRATIS_11700 [Tubulinosema ratisbonensis]|uniref:Uncharacterized protein n=1 Tax=Tubulinosema ratisbonensis TaxID=291195 RepID=A0A437AMP6_9MICR|nr:hypothetical protein TUBRATIS_11700 [Tubulinosema ratisbonensis]
MLTHLIYLIIICISGKRPEKYYLCKDCFEEQKIRLDSKWGKKCHKSEKNNLILVYSLMIYKQILQSKFISDIQKDKKMIYTLSEKIEKLNRKINHIKNIFNDDSMKNSSQKRELIAKLTELIQCFNQTKIFIQHMTPANNPCNVNKSDIYILEQKIEKSLEEQNNIKRSLNDIKQDLQIFCEDFIEEFDKINENYIKTIDICCSKQKKISQKHKDMGISDQKNSNSSEFLAAYKTDSLSRRGSFGISAKSAFAFSDQPEFEEFPDGFIDDKIFYTDNLVLKEKEMCYRANDFINPNNYKIGIKNKPSDSYKSILSKDTCFSQVINKNETVNRQNSSRKDKQTLEYYNFFINEHDEPIEINKSANTEQSSRFDIDEAILNKKGTIPKESFTSETKCRLDDISGKKFDFHNEINRLYYKLDFDQNEAEILFGGKDRNKDISDKLGYQNAD